jgi:hypothetical protein
MSFRKVSVIFGLLAVVMAVLISGCGIAAKPVSGSPHILSSPGFHGIYDDQRPTRAACLTRHHIPHTEYLTRFKIHGTPTDLQAIKVTPGGATIIFYPDANVAEGVEIMGGGLGAELIGSALLYPNNTTGKVLTEVENCTALGVG